MAQTHFVWRVVWPVLLLALCLPIVSAQAPRTLDAVDLGRSELSDAIHLFTQEERSLRRHFGFDQLPGYREAQRALCRDWQAALARTEFASLSAAGRVDYLLFEGVLNRKLERLDDEDRRYQAAIGRFPFLAEVADLTESRRRMRWVDPQAAAGVLARADAQLREALRDPAAAEDWSQHAPGVEAALADWHSFYHLYDPLFDWWVEAPYTQFQQTLQQARAAREGGAAEPGLDGVRVGEAELSRQLAAEWIPYSPRELIEIGRREMDWCIGEMRKVAVELGYAPEDWRQVLEHVKERAVPPGGQPELIRQMAVEAIDFLERHDLLTLPEMAKSDWHIDMLSPRQQLLNPFFTGGDVISLSYPTRTMSHERKLMSMRGNNPHFCWATVHHELLPGHHLQFYMARRHHAYRALFDTPFHLEGWALYWEMKLWDMGFARGPEDRAGMLFWRMHRCARIVFSLGYHLGLMSAEECVSLLVDTVGHERENARAEVRRSFAGRYPPLYQCAYLLGGLQLRALAAEVAAAGRISQKEFHDAVLHQGAMPIALLRARLLGLPIERPFASDWRFADPRP